MSLKVMQGAKTVDAANYLPDIKYLTLTVGATAQANSTGVDMSEHFEFIAVCSAYAVAAGCTLTWYVQESDTVGGTYTNITGASVVCAASAVNLSKWFTVNWKHPDRKRFARLSAIVTGANTATIAANSLRVNPSGGPVDISADVTEV